MTLLGVARVRPEEAATRAGMGLLGGVNQARLGQKSRVRDCSVSTLPILSRDVTVIILHNGVVVKSNHAR